MITLQGTLIQQNDRSRIEQEMFILSAIFSADIRCVGSDTVSAKPYFLIAAADSTTFIISDSINFAIPIQVRYFLTKSGTSSILFRSINAGNALNVGQNLTYFQLSYYDDTGNLLTPLPLSYTDRTKIKSISVTAQMTKATMTDTSITVWQMRFFPQNL
jgi:uncharacterized protein YqjF (DUF2071 family)